MLVVYPNFEAFDSILFILPIPVINIYFDLNTSWFTAIKLFSANFDKLEKQDNTAGNSQQHIGKSVGSGIAQRRHRTVRSLGHHTQRRAAGH